MVRTDTRTRLVAVGIGLMLALLSAACLQPSLNPLLLPADSTFDARLLGTWTSDRTTWTFSKATEREFGDRAFHEVTITERNETVKLWAWTGRLGDAQFVNFFPDDLPVTIESGFFQGHLVFAHTFGRIWIEDDRVRLGMLDSDWVEKAIKAGRFALGPKRWPNDQAVLTATTRQLQRVAREHANDQNAFGERIELTRKAQ